MTQDSHKGTPDKPPADASQSPVNSPATAALRPPSAEGGGKGATPVPPAAPAARAGTDTGGSGAQLVTAGGEGTPVDDSVFSISIESPTSQEPVVGYYKGVPVLVSISTNVDPTYAGQKVGVSVDFGSPTPKPEVINANDDYQFLVFTPEGGQITIYARMYDKWPSPTKTAVASVVVLPNDTPQNSATITTPADGAVIQTWKDPTLVSGKATFFATVEQPQVSVRIDGGSARLAKLGAATETGSLVSYDWSCGCNFTHSGPTTITAETAGKFTNSEGVVCDIPVQTPSPRLVTVEIDVTPPQVTVTDPPPSFQFPDDPNGVRITVDGTATDFGPSGATQSGVDSIFVNGVKASLTAGPDIWNWTATITAPAVAPSGDAGQRLINVVSCDQAGNTSSQTVTVYLMATVRPPLQPQDSVSILAYLRDLIDFSAGTSGRIAQADGVRIAAGDLETVFCQPFTRLVADTPVRQVRLCIEVLRKYLSGSSDAVGYWSLDRRSALGALDQSGHSLNGKLVNVTVLDQSPFGSRGGCSYAFNGENSHIDIGKPLSVNLATGLTMAAGIYPTGAGSGDAPGGVILCEEGKYGIARSADGTISFALASQKPGWKVWTDTGFKAPLRQWTHIVLTCDGRTAIVHANGREVFRTPLEVAVKTPGAPGRAFWIGGRQAGNQFFEGRIAEVRIFNRALDADEVLLLGGLAALDGPLLAAEADYRLSAYRMLLMRLGASYEELRLARAAKSADRDALASRLGLDLTARLDTLLLAPPDITEAKLEELFGLVDTTRDSLSPRAQEPSLLTWQKARLDMLWADEDHPDDADPDFPVPVIDPDLFVEGDFQPGPAGRGTNIAHDIWNARKAWVDGFVASLAADHVAGESDQARLIRMVEAQLDPVKMADLFAFKSSYDLGNDIDGKLKSVPLGFPAFTRILQLHDLAGVGTLMDDEWNAAYAILTEVQKARQFVDWDLEERRPMIGMTRGGGGGLPLPIYGPPIAISPAWFRLGLDSVELPEWRATDRDRQAWEDKLAARIALRDALGQALQSAVDATEEIVLPPLRDALLAAIGRIDIPSANKTGGGIANWLSQRLQIDVQSSGAVQTTRVSQAIETIQSILFSVRAGLFSVPAKPLGVQASWKIALVPGDIDETGFDQDWAWMGSYETWRGAMEVFLYPENVLLPSLPRVKATEAFDHDDPDPAKQGFLQRVRASMPLTRERARGLAQGYLDAVRNLSNQGGLGWSLPTELDAGSSFLITDDVDAVGFMVGQIETRGLTGWARLQSDPQYGVFKPKADGSYPPYLPEIFFFVPLYLALQLHKSGDFPAALDWFRLVYAYDLSYQKKTYYGLILEEKIKTQYERSVIWLRNLDPHEFIAPTRANAYTAFTLMSLIRCLMAYADSEFTRDDEESCSLSRGLYLNALDLLDTLDQILPAVDANGNAYPYQPNPIPAMLRQHATNSLLKLRSNRTIAGLQRPPGGGIDEGLAASSSAPLPTAYRYATLIDRARQLTQLAQQVESSFLAALQQKDAEDYNLRKANQDLELANSNLDLQQLKVDDANHGETLAQDQKARARTQFDAYSGWIDAGPLQSETDMIGQYKSANEARNYVAGLSAAVTALQAIQSASAASPLTLAGSFAIAGAVAGVAAGQAAEQIMANNAESQAQIDAANASMERRLQEWVLQRNIAQNDLAIGQDQIKLAQDQVAIATQEQKIAQIQSNNAGAIVNFLNSKFTNVELYEWMSEVLGGVYRYFLQQATAMAKLAENQLIFERQEAGLSFIKSDYWQPVTDTGTASTAAPDRRGLTGSAQLLQDITQLDQHAFLTNTRRLQITRTLSLARLAPFEFEQFRTTGVLPFATPMRLFDADFPGHYLRLIKRVRASVIALIPPSQGIKAELSASGISRVVIGDDVHQTVTVRRYPETVALTSPINATGLFELDAQPELLLPFEGSGVDTSWEFRMPRAANLFDYSTIADVVLTLDYTALESWDYRQQVIKGLNRKIGLDRAFSFRQDFADQWYQLNNPDQAPSAFSVQFATTRADFPPNIENLQIGNLLVYFVHDDSQDLQLGSVTLSFVPDGAKAPPLSGSADAIDGVISTRRGNAASWLGLVEKTPIGAWTLTIGDSPSGPSARSLFETGAIQDILFLLSYGGRTPAWPT